MNLNFRKFNVTEETITQQKKTVIGNKKQANKTFQHKKNGNN